jgi:hypothetical protein
MKAKIKDIAVGTEFRSIQFIERMKVDGVRDFIPLQHDEGFYIIGFPDPTFGCVYPKEWLDIVEE